MELATDAGASAPANATPAPVSPQPVTIVENPGPSIDDTMETVWADMQKREESQERPRDPVTKRFMPKNGAAQENTTEQPATATEAATAEGATEADAEQETTDQPQDAKEAPAQPERLPPHFWSAEMKAKWPTLPPDVQSYVSERELSSQQTVSRLGEQFKQAEQLVKSYEPLNSVLLAYKDDFARRGIHPAQGVAYLLQAQRHLEQNPVGALIDIARSVNVDLAAVLQAAGIDPRQYVGPSQQKADPHVSQIESKLNQALQKLDAYENRLAQQDSAAQQMVMTEAEQAITDFSKGKPYFEDVREDMGILLQANRAKDLDEAYKKACAMNESISTRIQADQRAKDEAKRKADEQAKAADARKSASVNVRSVPAKSNPTTLDDDLRANLDRIYG